jgi:hypothetical protein
MTKIYDRLSAKLTAQLGDITPLSLDETKQMINENSERQAKESDARLDQKLAVLSMRVDDSMNTLRNDFEKSTEVMATRFQWLECVCSG